MCAAATAAYDDKDSDKLLTTYHSASKFYFEIDIIENLRVLEYSNTLSTMN